MARIKDTSVDAVRRGAELVAVVEERTSLRKAGSQLTGRCPFHEERTASFSVDPAKGLYHCFGCGKGGDVFTFVRDTQALDWPGAVEWLADRFRIPIEYEDAKPGDDVRRNRRKRLYELLDQAASFYERMLWDSPAGSFARDYLAGRGLGEQVAREFRLGLAPEGGLLTRKAREKGFTVDELKDACLSGARGDYFQRRLLFPLTDVRGRVVGFQARKLHDDDPLPGKYVNTRDSELFTKGSVVYGFDKSKPDISKEDRAVVVEGNTDVLALRQAGFKPVVACMGTALTDAQLRELGRLTKRLWLAFDGDAAGSAATLRGMELAVAQGFAVNVVALTPGKDPADDPENFDARLAQAKPYALHRTQVEAQTGGFQAVNAFLRPLSDSPEKAEAVRWATDRFGMGFQLPSVRAAAETALSPKRVDAEVRRERSALAGVVAHPDLVPLLAAIPADHFHEETSRALRAHLVDGVPLDDDTIPLLAELNARAEAEGLDVIVAEELLLGLRERALEVELLHAPAERKKELGEKLLRLREGREALAKAKSG
ncbi:MAG TPA: DNA primase [Gaiellaceae bacterium]